MRVFVVSLGLCCGLAGCINNAPTNINTTTVGTGLKNQDAVEILNQEQNENGPSPETKGSMAIQWAAFNGGKFKTQATKEDIASFRLTLSGPPITAINGGPLSRTFTTSNGGTQVKNLPPGVIKVELLAMDAKGQTISNMAYAQATIREGVVTKVNLALKLIDSEKVVEEQAPVGHLEIGLTVVDGKQIIQKRTVIPQGGYFLFQDQIAPLPPCGVSNCLPALPAVGNLPSLPPLPRPNGGSAQNTTAPGQTGNQSEAGSATTCSDPFVRENEIVFEQSSVPLFEETDASSFIEELEPADNEAILSLLKRLEAEGASAQTPVASKLAIHQFLFSGIDPTRDLSLTQVQGASTACGGNSSPANLPASSLPAPATTKTTPQQPTQPPAAAPSKPQASLGISPVGHHFSGDYVVLSANKMTGSIESFHWVVQKSGISPIDLTTVQTSTPVLLAQPGKYTVYLWLNAHGQSYPASDNPRFIDVEAKIEPQTITSSHATTFSSKRNTVNNWQVDLGLRLEPDLARQLIHATIKRMDNTSFSEGGTAKVVDQTGKVYGTLKTYPPGGPITFQIPASSLVKGTFILYAMLKTQSGASLETGRVTVMKNY